MNLQKPQKSSVNVDARRNHQQGTLPRNYHHPQPPLPDTICALVKELKRNGILPPELIKFPMIPHARPLILSGIMFTGLQQIPTDYHDPPRYVCNNCWSFGHKRKDCLRGTQRRCCHNCGRDGVIITTCPRCSQAHSNFLEGLDATGANDFIHYRYEPPRYLEANEGTTNSQHVVTRRPDSPPPNSTPSNDSDNYMNWDEEAFLTSDQLVEMGANRLEEEMERSPSRRLDIIEHYKYVYKFRLWQLRRGDDVLLYH